MNTNQTLPKLQEGDQVRIKGIYPQTNLGYHSYMEVASQNDRCGVALLYKGKEFTFCLDDYTLLNDWGEIIATKAEIIFVGD